MLACSTSLRVFIRLSKYHLIVFQFTCELHEEVLEISGYAAGGNVEKWGRVTRFLTGASC